MSPSRKPAVAKKRGSGSARKVNSYPDNTDRTRWPRETDTFKVLHGSGLLYRVLREFGWEASSVEEAVAWAAPQFRNLRPASSATCSDQNTLTAFLTKHYLWGCETYDPAKAMGNARRRARIADEARIEASMRLDDRALDAYLKGVVGLSVEEMECVRRYRVLERKHAGRMACRTIYAAFGGQQRLLAFQTRHCLLSVAQEYSQSQGRCRQWTLAPRVVCSVRMLMAVPVLLLLMRCGGEKVIYSKTRPRDPLRKSRISAARPARGTRHTLESVAVTPAARGPPPEAPKTHENEMLDMTDGAAGARRRGRNTVEQQQAGCRADRPNKKEGRSPVARQQGLPAAPSSGGSLSAGARPWRTPTMTGMSPKPGCGSRSAAGKGAPLECGMVLGVAREMKGEGNDDPVSAS